MKPDPNLSPKPGLRRSGGLGCPRLGSATTGQKFKSRRPGQVTVWSPIALDFLVTSSSEDVLVRARPSSCAPSARRQPGESLNPPLTATGHCSRRGKRRALLREGVCHGGCVTGRATDATGFMHGVCTPTCVSTGCHPRLAHPAPTPLPVSRSAAQNVPGPLLVPCVWLCLPLGIYCSGFFLSQSRPCGVSLGPRGRAPRTFPRLGGPFRASINTMSHGLPAPLGPESTALDIGFCSANLKGRLITKQQESL